MRMSTVNRRPKECEIARIQSIEVRALAPDVERFRYTDREPEVTTTTTLVRVHDDAGTSGVGAYDADSFGDWDRAPLETLRTVVPRLLGMDVNDIDGVSAVMDEDGTSPFAPAVRSAVDIALWDLAARRRGEPLHLTLGGDESVRSLPSYASVPMMDDEDAYLASLASLTAQGFNAVKLHAWGDPERDVHLLRGVRDAFPDVVLMHDAEGRYDRDGARIVARACAEVGVRWLEAPLPDFDLDGYRWLRGQEPGVPMLAGGDVIWDARLMAEVLRDPPWDAVRFDVSFVGGPTKARELMTVAGDAGLMVELISYGHTVIQAANLHTALAFGRTTYFEQAVPTEPFEHGVGNPIRTGRDGCVRVPDGPGLGIDLDDEAVAAATLDIVRAGKEG